MFPHQPMGDRKFGAGQREVREMFLVSELLNVSPLWLGTEEHPTVSVTSPLGLAWAFGMSPLGLAWASGQAEAPISIVSRYPPPPRERMGAFDQSLALLPNLYKKGKARTVLQATSFARSQELRQSTPLPHTACLKEKKRQFT